MLSDWKPVTAILESASSVGPKIPTGRTACDFLPATAHRRHRFGPPRHERRSCRPAGPSGCRSSSEGRVPSTSRRECRERPFPRRNPRPPCRTRSAALAIAGRTAACGRGAAASAPGRDRPRRPCSIETWPFPSSLATMSRKLEPFAGEVRRAGHLAADPLLAAERLRQSALGRHATVRHGPAPRCRLD